MYVIITENIAEIVAKVNKHVCLHINPPLDDSCLKRCFVATLFLQLWNKGFSH